MLFTLVISMFFGLVAAAALLVNGVMIQRGIHAARAIRCELAAIDRAAVVPTQARRGQSAFA